MENPVSRQPKVFNDPVHGHMEFHPLCVAIIDTPEFQRLRFLKQMGMVYFVYPGASHNRFEHSLGVCFLAGEMVETLRKNQPELEINDEDVLCVKIAGLCHDLGHGPFSHVFDNKFIPKMMPGTKWTHEQASIEIFDYLVEKNNLGDDFKRYKLGEEHRDFIKELISNEMQSKRKTQWKCGPKSPKRFLYEIVANKRNGVDVDKWDYFKRDSLQLGMSTSFDHTRFIKFSRVLEVEGERQICVRDKEAFDMYEMFHTRHALHRRACQHRVVQAIEIMLVDAMKEADAHLKIPGKNGKSKKMSQCIDDMEAYVKLTDAIFQQILLDERPELKTARDILQNILKRRLYQCIAETKPITDEGVMKMTDEDIRKEIVEEIKKLDKAKSLEKLESEFTVQIAKLDYGKKGENPVDHIWFYSKHDKDTPISFSANEISSMIPQRWHREHLVRLVLHPSMTDRVAENVLLDAFKKWCCTYKLDEPKIYRPPAAAQTHKRHGDQSAPSTSTKMRRRSKHQ